MKISHRNRGMNLLILIMLFGAAAGQANGNTWIPAIPNISSFQNPLKWSPNVVPGPASFAEFNYAASPTVTFAANANTARLFVSDFSNVLFDLSGYTYTLSAPTGYQLFIGTPGMAGGTPQLILTNGTLAADLASLGGWGEGGLGGSLQVSSGATLNISDVLMVGEFETSYFNVVNGGNATIAPTGHLVVAFEDGLTSTVSVQGAGSTLTAGEHLHLGWFGDGQITVSSGGAFSAMGAVLGQEAGSTGTATVQSGGSWTTSGAMNIGEMGAGTLTVSNAGTTLSNGLTHIGFAPGSTGSATIETGATADLGFTVVGNSGSGTLTIRSGAVVSSGPEAAIGMLPGSTGSVTLTDAGSTWNIAGGLGVGGMALGGPGLIGGTGSLTISTGTTVNVAGLGGVFGTALWPTGTITLNGGTLTTPRLADNGGTFAFNSGTLRLTNSDFSIGTGGLLGASLTLDAGKTLSVSGVTSVESGAVLAIDGGTFSTGSLSNAGAFAFNSGTLAITDASGLTIGSGGPLGSAYTLGAGRTLNVSNTTTVNGGAVLVVESGGTFTSGTLANSGTLVLDGAAAVLGGTAINNSGLIRGEGVVSGIVTNIGVGEIRAQAGKTLTFDGANGTNAGTINLQGGTADFSQALTNGATGRIQGRGTISFGGAGLTNNGQVALSSGITDVFGDVTNNTGTASVGVSISGNADVTFWDDVTNAAGSLFRVSSGSSATFFGTYGGAGISGSGNVYFEADVTPGFSPATVDFGGDVSLGSNANLVIELGGTMPGSQHDQVNVTGLLTLGGTLDVRFINGFIPSAGNTFNILNTAGVSGTFDAVNLPSLGGSLAWNTSQLFETGALGVALAGDFNFNGVVDGGDYTEWRNGLGTKYTQNDYNVWRSNFGKSAGISAGASGGNAAVPEPHSIVLFAFGMILAASRRNSQRRNSK